MSKRNFYKQVAIPAMVCLLATGATGLAAPGPNVDAGSVLRDVQQTERALPERQKPDVHVEQPVKPPMVQDSAFKLKVNSFRITGQNVIPQAQLTALLSAYQGKELDMNGLQQAANQVAKYFRDQGYFITQAYLPVQEIENGQVEIAVIIGKYGNIILKNNTVVPDSVIKQQLSGIAPGSYVHNSSMERAALLASDLPGVSAQTTLVPGKQPGTTDIVVEAKQKGNTWQGAISASNYGSRLTGYNQGQASASLSNPFKRGDSFTASFTNTGAGLDAGSASYRTMIGEGSALTVSYSKVAYELGQDMAALGAKGTAYTTHGDWTYAWQRSRLSNLSLQIGYDHKRLEDRIEQSSDSTNKTSHAVSLGILGDSTDTWGGGGANSYSLQHYRGQLSGTTSAGVTLPVGDYGKTTYSLMRQQFLQDRLSLFVMLSGQWSNANLDSSEKFSLGGPNAVRAYPNGEAAGDEAWLGTAELRYSIPSASKNGTWQAAAFYDTGSSLSEKNPTQSVTANKRTLSGTGLSLSYAEAGSYMVKATYAWRVGSEEPQSDTTFGKGRLWLQAVKYF